MEPWSAKTLARWDRRSRRVLLLAGVLLLAAYLLPRPRVDGDGLLQWTSPFDFDGPRTDTAPFGPQPLVPQTLAFVALGAWLLIAARRQPLSRRGASVAWASAGLVLSFAALRAQFFSPAEGRGANLGWPWWDGTWAIPALGLLLVRCAGQRRFGRSLCVLAGCVGLVPVLLAPMWNLDHIRWWWLIEDEHVWVRLFAVARGLTMVAAVALLWYGLGPPRARGRLLVASRLWIASFLAALLASAASVVEGWPLHGTPAGTGLCVWIGFLLEVAKQLSPLAAMVAGLFLVVATSRRPAGEAATLGHGGPQ